jgi:isoleucyl-tRNA synthetase
VPVAEMVEIDRYALAMTARTQQGVAQDYEEYQFHLGMQKLLAFCSEDLGAFYLVILKDRLYTCGGDSKARRSAQTALWHVTNSLLRLMAPVLSFTAEEAWQVFARKPDDSVLFHTLHQIPDAKLPDGVLNAWGDVRQFRDIVSKRIEEKRIAKELGSSLQAEIDIHASGAIYESLRRLGDDLRFVLITSRATVKQGDLPVLAHVTPSTHPKCDRCWHYRADVNADALCGRCQLNLKGPGEPRRFA